MFYKSVQNVDLRKQLENAAVALLVVMFVLFAFLFVQNLVLRTKIQALETTVLALAATTPQVAQPVQVVERVEYDDDQLRAEIQNLVIRMDAQESRRFIELPQGSNDLGAAMEHTVQWQGLSAQVGAHETDLFEMSSSLSTIDTRINNAYWQAVQSANHNIATVVDDFKYQLLASGMEPHAILVYTSEIVDLGAEWIWPEGTVVMTTTEQVLGNDYVFVAVSIPAGEEVTLINPYNSGETFTFVVEGFRHYTSFVGLIEVCDIGTLGSIYGTCETVLQYTAKS